MKACKFLIPGSAFLKNLDVRKIDNARNKGLMPLAVSFLAASTVKCKAPQGRYGRFFQGFTLEKSRLLPQSQKVWFQAAQKVGFDPLREAISSHINSSSFFQNLTDVEADWQTRVETSRGITRLPGPRRETVPGLNGPEELRRA